ncbi:MAG: hypothetical protein RL196_420 [Actinomycetota bacterium]|jgi:hypothetical protein
MPRLNFNSDRGSAPLEVLGYGIFLLLPITWFSIDIIGQQNDQFAATAMAEHGLRAWVQEDHAQSLNFETALAQIASDFHENRSDVSWQIDCAEVMPCLPKGQVIRLKVKVKQATATAVMRWSK